MPACLAFPCEHIFVHGYRGCMVERAAGTGSTREPGIWKTIVHRYAGPVDWAKLPSAKMREHSGRRDVPKTSVEHLEAFVQRCKGGSETR